MHVHAGTRLCPPPLPSWSRPGQDAPHCHRSDFAGQGPTVSPGCPECRACRRHGGPPGSWPAGDTTPGSPADSCRPGPPPRPAGHSPRTEGFTVEASRAVLHMHVCCHQVAPSRPRRRPGAGTCELLVFSSVGWVLLPLLRIQRISDVVTAVTVTARTRAQDTDSPWATGQGLVCRDVKNTGAHEGQCQGAPKGTGGGRDPGRVVGLRKDLGDRGEVPALLMLPWSSVPAQREVGPRGSPQCCGSAAGGKGPGDPRAPRGPP